MFLLAIGGQSIDDFLAIDLTWPQDRVRETRLVWRVRKTLGLKGQTGRLAVETAATRRRAIEIVSGIKLCTRLSGQNFENPAARHRMHPRGQSGRSIAKLRQYIVMIIAAAETQLLVGCANASANPLAISEIEGRPSHRV